MHDLPILPIPDTRDIGEAAACSSQVGCHTLAFTDRDCVHTVYLQSPLRLYSGMGSTCDYRRVAVLPTDAHHLSHRVQHRGHHTDADEIVSAALQLLFQSLQRPSGEGSIEDLHLMAGLS